MWSVPINQFWYMCKDWSNWSHLIFFKELKENVMTYFCNIMQDRDWQLAQAFYHFRKKFKTFKLVHNKSKVFWDKQTQSGLTCPTLLSNTGTSWPFSSRSQRLPKDTAPIKNRPTGLTGFKYNENILDNIHEQFKAYKDMPF